MAKDRELQDHERAHSGKAGAKVRHGTNVTGSNVTGRHHNAEPEHVQVMRTVLKHIEDFDNEMGGDHRTDNAMVHLHGYLDRFDKGGQ